jgi:DUF4097 and DUF4098 domain-containing protein YvlB
LKCDRLSARRYSSSSNKNVKIVFGSVEDVSLTEVVGSVEISKPKYVTI